MRCLKGDRVGVLDLFSRDWSWRAVRLAFGGVRCVSSNRSHRSPPPRRPLPSHPSTFSDSNAVDREIAALEQRLRDVESELARLKVARDKAKR